jgi:hypothetical protein
VNFLLEISVLAYSFDFSLKWSKFILKFDSRIDDAGNSDPEKLREKAAELERLSADELLKRQMEIKVTRLADCFRNDGHFLIYLNLKFSFMFSLY